jgi:arginine metabolism regulation protein II
MFAQLLSNKTAENIQTLMGMPNDARCYLIHAERLLRLRGLAKREVSRRARLLHHVYTWLRIIGESTFVLHDHRSGALQHRIESILNANSGIPELSPMSDRSRNTIEEYSELDDFLRIETHATENDTDLDSSKDQTAGLRDIHLADVRQWPQTLYMEVYGIPEIWLSLVSQVTRIANVMDILESSSIVMPQAFTGSIQAKLDRLEHKICSFSAEHSTISPLPLGHESCTESDTASSILSIAQQAMLRAMSSALVIFFYRRIRKVHTWILQAHVNDVIKALKDFGEAHEYTCSSTSGTIGTPWPAFIAGCEAMSLESQQWLSDWIENAASRSKSSGFLDSQQVMRRVGAAGC